MSKENDFRIDTSDYLGISHSTYKNRLMSLALTQPSQYFKLREIVAEKVKEQAIKSMYNTFYYVMTEGKGYDGTKATGQIAESIKIDGVSIFAPNLPK